MNIDEIRHKIMTDDDFVVEELNKLALYYNLKHTIRWAHNRGDEDVTESVAEHVYGLHILIDYFLPLIDTESKYDKVLLHSIATWHDMAEAIVSDMTSVSKTEQHKQAEKEAETELTNSSTSHLHPLLEKIFSEYDEGSTPEARLIKALDKIEPMFHLYFLTTKKYSKEEVGDLVWGADEYRNYRKPHLQEFDILMRFDEILLKKNKHFHPKK